jgi:hypothetical protein
MHVAVDEKMNTENTGKHINQWGIVAHTCSPSTQEELKFKVSLSYIIRPYLKKKKKN